MTGADTQRGVILRLNTLFLRYLPFSFITVDLLNGKVRIIMLLVINRSNAPTIFFNVCPNFNYCLFVLRVFNYLHLEMPYILRLTHILLIPKTPTDRTGSYSYTYIIYFIRDT